MTSATITLYKGGAKEHTVKISNVRVPDLWHIAQTLLPANKETVLKCWHLTHDLLREVDEAKQEINKLNRELAKQPRKRK